MDGLVPLGDLQPGQSAVVGRILGHADDVHRLREFGLCDGTRLEMFRRGSPCIVRVAGNKFCIRAHHLLRVLVRPVGDAPA